jgi:hypothetical protein
MKCKLDGITINYESYGNGRPFAALDRAERDLQIEQEKLFNALVNEWLQRVEEHAKNNGSG